MRSLARWTIAPDPSFTSVLAGGSRVLPHGPPRVTHVAAGASCLLLGWALQADFEVKPVGRLLKLLGIVAVALVLLFVAVIVGVALLFDPNDYREEIAAAVERETGRELALVGDLELEVFPRLRIAVGEAVLGNAPGFGDEPFARIGSARLQLALLPLLSRRVEIGEARLEGLVLNLARDAQGRNNWQDLGGAPAAPAEEPAESAEPAAGGASFDVEVIELVNARVSWNDELTGSAWQLYDFNMRASGFGPDTAFPIRMAFGLAAEAVEVTVSAESRATLSLAQNHYLLEDLDVRMTGSGERWPGGRGEARLHFDALAADLDAETLDLDNLALEFLGVRAVGSLSGRQLLGDLQLEGAVDIETFNPRDVFGVFGVQIETADAGVLRSAGARANLVYNGAEIGLHDMALRLDDSELTGRLAVEGGEALRFALAVNAINIDRYLPPAEEPGEVAEEGSLDEVDLPLDVLRAIDAAGELSIGQAQLMGLTLSDTVFTLRAANGDVTLSPRTALYGGTYAGSIRLQVRDDAARMTLTSELQGVDLLPLATDLMEFDLISGTGRGTLNLTATGSNVGQMRHALAGDVAFTFADGAYEGIDLWYELRRARAVLDREAAPDREGRPRRTPYSQISATGVVEEALLTTRDIAGAFDFMEVTGSGTVHLITDEVDLDMTARFVDGATLQSDSAMARLAGAELPLRVGGTLEELSIRPDFAAVVRERVREEVREEVRERIEEEGVRERIEEEQEELRERVRDRLRGILPR
jgi:AsmA protein